MKMAESVGTKRKSEEDEEMPEPSRLKMEAGNATEGGLQTTDISVEERAREEQNVEAAMSLAPPATSRRSATCVQRAVWWAPTSSGRAMWASGSEGRWEQLRTVREAGEAGG
mgnify:CR=1 FL=1